SNIDGDHHKYANGDRYSHRHYQPDSDTHGNTDFHTNFDQLTDANGNLYPHTPRHTGFWRNPVYAALNRAV
ncbi:MAG: hypothetical protein AAGK74_18735, partial [Chloroflexota bacterium]